MRLRVEPAVAAVLATVLMCAEATQPARAVPQPKDPVTGQARRAIIYVDDDNTSGPWDGTFEHPYQYIQDGIDNAAAGDTVMVLAGTYLENVIVDRSVMLLGEDVETTIIDAGGIAEAVYVAADGVTVSGFTMTGAGGLGAIVLASNGNMVSGNHLTHNNEVFWAAIYLTGSSYNDIHDNRITYTDREAAIWLNWASCGNTISRNTITNNGFCAVTFWYESTNNTISENTFIDNRNGIWVDRSSHNTFANNTFANNEFDGISVSQSTHLVISDNSFERGGGIVFRYGNNDPAEWDTHTIEGNTVNGAPIHYYKKAEGVFVPDDAGQVILAGCSGCVIQGLAMLDAVTPIQVAYCRDTVISENTVGIDWYSDGILHVQSSHGVISGNTVTSTYQLYDYDPAVRIVGVYLQEGGENSVYENIITGFNEGILLQHRGVSDNNLLYGNTVASKLIGVWLIQYSGSGENMVVSSNSFSDCERGAIWLSNWPRVTLEDNAMTGCSVFIDGEELSHWNTHTFQRNTVNDRPVVYYVDQEGIAVPPDVGQVILANCSDFVVDGLTLADTSVGVLGGFCTNGSISNSVFSHCGMAAVYLRPSSEITVSENTISGGRDGIWLYGGDDHAVVGNRIEGGGNLGLYVSHAARCDIHGNTVTGVGHVGIHGWTLSESSIAANTVTCSGLTGISLSDESSGNVLTNNVAAHNGTFGLLLYSNSTDNTIVYNDFVENWMNARELDGSSGNHWSGTSGGNFWSDFEQNPGYPDYYEIPGDGDGVDWDPLESVFSCPFLPGDVNGTCGEVDFADFEALVDCWEIWPDDCGDYGCSDLDGDGDVDLHDFAAFSLLFGSALADPPACLGAQ